jgi:hypothetical protein
MALPGEGADLTAEGIRNDLLTITREVAAKLGIPEGNLSYSHTDRNEKNESGNTKSCTYFNPDGTPACIIGHWFHQRYGIGLQDMTDEANQQGFCDIVNDYLPDIPEEAERFIVNAQGYQDDDEPWAYAIKTAWNDHLEELGEEPDYS